VSAERLHRTAVVGLLRRPCTDIGRIMSRKIGATLNSRLFETETSRHLATTEMLLRRSIPVTVAVPAGHRLLRPAEGPRRRRWPVHNQAAGKQHGECEKLGTIRAGNQRTREQLFADRDEMR